MPTPTTIKTDPALQEKVEGIQSMLEEEKVDGWLFYFFKNNDPIAFSVLGRSKDAHFSRRWFYFIPASGEPVKLVHRIEMDVLDDLPGRKVVYLGWKELEEKLAEVLAGSRKIAMQYSPKNAVPYVARVDAGTIELVTALDKSVVSSANLVQSFEARWDEEQLKSHIYATDCLRKVVDETFAEVRSAVGGSRSITEWDVQCFMMTRFDHYGLTTYSPPIVAVNANSGSPHYQPTEKTHSPVKKGDFLLIDLWAKRRDFDRAIYGDITWTGYIGETVPEKYAEIFAIVSGARDAALEFIRKAVAQGETIYGWQADDVTRQYIEERGYGKYFVHRTGHSIGLEVHGNGANLDNLETREERKLIAKTGFSIEPGIYQEEFGIRSEIDAYISDNQTVEVYGQPIQTAVVPILAS